MHIFTDRSVRRQIHRANTDTDNFKGDPHDHQTPTENDTSGRHACGRRRPGTGADHHQHQWAPPPIQYEAVPVLAPTQIWAPGYWAWNGDRHVWVRGRAISKRDGYRWAPDNWVQTGNGYSRQPGYWVRDTNYVFVKEKKAKKHKYDRDDDDHDDDKKRGKRDGKGHNKTTESRQRKSTKKNRQTWPAFFKVGSPSSSSGFQRIAHGLDLVMVALRALRLALNQ
jgi:hypothetical protein